MSDIDDYEDNQPLPPPELLASNEPQREQNQTQNLLCGIAQAFRDIVMHDVPLTARENNWVHVKTFKGEDDEDPVE